MRHFLRIIAIFMAPIFLLCGVFFTGLLRSGELADSAALADATVKGDVALYGLAYRDDTRAYKQRVTAQKSAELLVLGTSRSMQFRGDFFKTDSFYNAGGAAAYLPQMLFFLQSLPKESLPKHLLLVLDQYFYNETWGNVDNERDTAPFVFQKPDIGYSFRRMLSGYLDSKYSLLRVLQTPQGVYGMSAAGKNAGFYADGSYTYGTALLHPEQSLDYGFKNTLSRIDRGIDRFEYGAVCSRENIAATEKLLAFCKENAIAVTAVLPPYAPAVWQAMQTSGQYGYLAEIMPALAPLFAAYDAEILDYSYLPETNDAQYVDGFHGSDRVYAAVCLRLAQDSVFLRDFLDADALQTLFLADGNPLSLSFAD
ncbi:MAG: hypothetical protein RSF84_03490 [Ruthenibacterium sp.]